MNTPTHKENTMNTTEIRNALDLIDALNLAPNITTVTQPNSGRWVIVRGDRSGVFFGRLMSEEGQTVELTECRHVWYWAGAANTAEMANSGVSKPADCKIVAPVSRIRILDAIEVLDCTEEASESLSNVPHWSKS